MLKEFIMKLNDDEEVLASWMTRTDFNEWYCKDEPLTDEQWYLLEENVGFEGDVIDYEINWVRQITKAEDENIR